MRRLSLKHVLLGSLVGLLANRSLLRIPPFQTRLNRRAGSRNVCLSLRNLRYRWCGLGATSVLPIPFRLRPHKVGGAPQYVLPPSLKDPANGFLHSHQDPPGWARMGQQPRSVAAINTQKLERVWRLTLTLRSRG